MSTPWSGAHRIVSAVPTQNATRIETSVQNGLRIRGSLEGGSAAPEKTVGRGCTDPVVRRARPPVADGDDRRVADRGDRADRADGGRRRAAGEAAVACGRASGTGACLRARAEGEAEAGVAD